MNRLSEPTRLRPRRRLASVLVLTSLSFLVATGTACDPAPSGEAAEEPAPAADVSAPAPETTDAAETTAAPRPSPPEAILLVSIDTLRHDALGSYGGGAETAALDALAADGTRFEDAVAHAVMTLPSHVSIFTGLEPSRHGVHDNSGFRAGDELHMAAERLRDAGYDTGAFVGAFPMDSLFGLAQGFDVYDDRYGDRSAPTEVHMVERPATRVVSAALGWIRERTEPWFAFVHVYDPHAPYEPPEPFASRYADEPYLGEVAATDEALGSLLEEARRRDALILVTSDHGEALGDHGERTHGIFAYRATLQVPLIVAWPGVLAEGRVVTDRVRLIDLLPTLLDLVGEPDPDLPGTSLRGSLQGGEVPEAASTSYFEALTAHLGRNWAPLRGMHRGRWKYIHLPVPELYDLAADPDESDNLADAEPERVDELSSLLAEHLAATEASDEIAPDAEQEEVLRRLRALGYVSGGPEAGLAGDASWTPEDDPKALIHLQNRVDDAVAEIADGNLTAAEPLLRSVIDERPDFLSAYTLLAMVEHRRGRLDEAIATLRPLVESGEATAYVTSRLAFYLSEAGRTADAVEGIERAVAADPDNVELLTLGVMVMGRAGRRGDALRYLDRAMELDPTYATLHANRGTLLLEGGRDAEARAAFERALELDPQLADAHNGLGVVAARAGDLESAVEHWGRAVELDPRQWDALYNLGVQLTELSRLEEAIPALERFVQQAPRDRYGDDIPGLRRLLERLREVTGVR